MVGPDYTAPNYPTGATFPRFWREGAGTLSGALRIRRSRWYPEDYIVPNITTTQAIHGNFDISKNIGMGHFYRCINIAQLFDKNTYIYCSEYNYLNSKNFGPCSKKFLIVP